MRLTVVAFISALFAPMCAAAAPTDPAPVAKAWLALIDHGRYAKSWAAAGSVFKAHISAARWTQMASKVRAPLGSVASRAFAGDEPSTSLPGVPDGTYDQIHFSTVFAHKSSATETMVMARQKDGWRVDGYFIR